MQIGDTFIDDNRVFEVVGFDGKYDVSKFIGFVKDAKPFVKKEVKEETKEAKEEAKEDFEDMTYQELKTLCSKKGLSAKGSKQDLIDRLRV